MSEPVPHGPPLSNDERLLRVIAPVWWVSEAGRVSSAAFSWPVFSVDRASLTTAEATLSRFDRASGLAEFGCVECRPLGFDPRDELDPAHPDNKAHAHVYHSGPNNRRKAAARRLAELCRIVKPPTPVAP